TASLAVVFPGPGTPSLGMLAEQGAQLPLILDTFEQASEALGYDLWALTQNAPVESINQTDNTQPAIQTDSLAFWNDWLEVV
ncbi:malonyl CoA-acyl carrier protein transacylase, partial [Pseudomonas syringae pv. tagetis]